MSEQNALNDLRRVKDSYRNFVRDNFESAAQNCQTCPTFGACCLDAHFVNVHITRLEAVAIGESLAKLSEAEQQAVQQRTREAVEKYNLSESGDTFAQTFACPLFEPRVGCLVHAAGKPAACIHHACYNRQEDLPPACLQDNAERKIEKLNQEVYGGDWRWLPIPVWLQKINSDVI